MLVTARDEAAPLLGRDEEQSLLWSLLDEVAIAGQALVLRGQPGVGKSRLLSDAARNGRERGMSVLTTTGVQSEADLPFAGLHQLLRPVRGRATELPAVQRAALDAAFGLTRDAAPEHFRIAMAALDLLSEVATDAPLLIVADDAHWLDRPTSEALAFIARRIESDPIILLAAIRDGYPSVLGDAGLLERRLSALDDAAAAQLLDISAPKLSVAMRSRVLREAPGNPLALLELPAAARHHEDELWAPGPLPLTDRLERAFAAHVAELPDQTRLVLLVAALDDGDEIREVLNAGSAVAGTELDFEVVVPAVEARLIDVDLHTFRFRHPLIRSAVAQSAGVGGRRRAHEALATVLADQPDRRAWHRAALLSGEHEEIALELEQAAARAQRQGAIAVAVSAMRRAAELSPPPSRIRRLLSAARLAVELGRRDAVTPLLREVNRLDLGDLERARVTWIEETAFTRPLGEVGRFTSLIQRARIQLAYGQWLRRQRRVAESRAVLRAARDAFDALGCRRWSEHARRELRASGERSRHHVPEVRDQLTAQELQIAQLAAEGLSNRDIGRRLYLSHRTISTHLYRVFPKLGITSRGELSAALAPRSLVRDAPHRVGQERP